MDIADLILVGIRVAQRWPESDLKEVTIRAVPKKTREWIAVIYTRAVRYVEHRPASQAPQFAREKVRLERFRFGDGEIWSGYGSESRHLLFWIPNRF